MSDEGLVLEGTLDTTRLPEVLGRIGNESATGILTVQGAEDIVAVSFLSGQVVSADALNQTVEDGLGEVLVGQGLVEADRFRAAARDHLGGSSGSLGDALVERGLLRRDQLLGALRMQMFRLMKQVLTWREGEYRFYGGDEVSYETGLEPLGIEELLIRALEDLGKDAGLPGKAPRLDETFVRIPGKKVLLGQPGEQTSGDEVLLTKDEISLLERVDGSQTGAAIAKSLGLGRYPALYRLYSLGQKGIIEGRAVQRPAGGTAPESVAPVSAQPPIGTRSPGPASLDDSLLGSLSLGTPDLPGVGGGADVFQPPQVAIPTTDEETVEESDDTSDFADYGVSAVSNVEDTQRLSAWAGRALALLGLIALVLGFLGRPAKVLWSLPYQESQRATYEHLVRDTLFTKLDRAARTFFLSEAHYPDSLGQLVGAELIAQADLRDPQGHVIGYSSESVSYQIEMLQDGRPIEGLGVSEAIAGDFLLDPQLIPPTSGKAPLFLIED